MGVAISVYYIYLRIYLVYRVYNIMESKKSQIKINIEYITSNFNGKHIATTECIIDNTPDKIGRIFDIIKSFEGIHGIPVYNATEQMVNNTYKSNDKYTSDYKEYHDLLKLSIYKDMLSIYEKNCKLSNSGFVKYDILIDGLRY